MLIKVDILSNFNPRSREGSDPTTGQGMPSTHHFNPRSREGSDTRRRGCWPIRTDFNPRSREGSDPAHVGVCAARRISIHAPVKGATCTVGQLADHVSKISIHAPVKGATIHQRLAHTRMGHFNPRSREGSDTRIGGADPYMSHFNPRSREGSDMK